jgi:hypothetical protein
MFVGFDVIHNIWTSPYVRYKILRCTPYTLLSRFYGDGSFLKMELLS